MRCRLRSREADGDSTDKDGIELRYVVFDRSMRGRSVVPLG